MNLKYEKEQAINELIKHNNFNISIINGVIIKDFKVCNLEELPALIAELEQLKDIINKNTDIEL